MKYNDPRHLANYRAGRYPAIHDDMYVACGLTPPEGYTLDLCCSTGLLGRRVANAYGVRVVGVDADARALAAGPLTDTVALRLTPDTLPALGEIIRERGVEYVIARRCLAELAKVLPLADLAATLAPYVHTIVMEGHGPGKNPMLSADAQAAAMTGYRVTDTYRNTRTLRQ